MILECEKCNARYEVPDDSIGPQGRKVRCAKCGHDWVQMGAEPEEMPESIAEEPPEDINEPEADSEEDDMSFSQTLASVSEEDDGLIPESVKPLPQEEPVIDMVDDLKRHNPDEEEEGVKYRRALGGYAAAAAVFVLIAGFMVLIKGPLTSAWPASIGFYQMIGAMGELPGEGLVFESLKATAGEDGQGRAVLNVAGKIMNIREKNHHHPGHRSQPAG